MYANTSQPLSGILRSQIEASVGFSDIVLSNMQDLLDLNLRLVKGRMDTLTHGAIDTTVTGASQHTYPLEIYKTMMNSQTQLLRLLGEHFEQSNRQSLALINEMLNLTDNSAEATGEADRFQTEGTGELNALASEIALRAASKAQSSVDNAARATDRLRATTATKAPAAPLAGAGDAARVNKKKAKTSSSDPIGDAGDLPNIAESATPPRTAETYSRRGEARGRKPADFSRKGERNAKKLDAEHLTDRLPGQHSRKGEVAARREEDYSRKDDGQTASAIH